MKKRGKAAGIVRAASHAELASESGADSTEKDNWSGSEYWILVVNPALRLALRMWEQLS